MGVIRETILEALCEKQNEILEAERRLHKESHKRHLKESKRANDLFRLSFNRKMTIEKLKSENAYLRKLLDECKGRVLLCMEMTSVGYEDDERLLKCINAALDDKKQESEE